MSISPIEKFIILTEGVALLTKIFMGKKANLVKFISLNIFLMFFAADLNLRKNVFKIDMPPSFLLWRIVNCNPERIKRFQRHTAWQPLHHFFRS